MPAQLIAADYEPAVGATEHVASAFERKLSMSEHGPSATDLNLDNARVNRGVKK
jgi:hypothetical protein